MDWTIIDHEFFSSLGQPTPEDFRRFFDGATPKWECVLSGIPRREAAERVVDQLLTKVDSSTSLHLVIGPSGEGKSTLIRQVAVDMAREPNWRVFWRPRKAALEPDKVLALPVDTFNNLFVADDGDEIVDECFESVNRLEGRRNVHFLLAARDTDWTAVRGDSLGWGILNLELRRHPLRGLAGDGVDATRIVHVWAQYDALGQLASFNRVEDRVRVLLEETQREATVKDGALLGGMLRARIGGRLDDHVLQMVERLRRWPIGSQGRTLAHAFIYIAALHAIDLQVMTPRLLAGALSIDPAAVDEQVVIPLGDEAAAVQVGQLVLVRHRAIAESAMRVARDRLKLDVKAVYARLTRIGIRAAKEPASDLDLKDFRFMSMKLKDAPELALASAQAACEEEPDDVRRITNLFVVFSENRLENELVRKAEAVAGDLRQMTNYRQAARHFFYQWSVAKGKLGDHATACWLNALAVADLPNVQPLEARDIEVRLPGLGPAFRDLASGPPGTVFGRGLRALETMLREWSVNDRTRRDLNRYRAEADRLGVPPADFETCTTDLVAAIVAAWDQRPRSLDGAIPDAPTLTYSQLFALLAEHPVSAQRQWRPLGA